MGWHVTAVPVSVAVALLTAAGMQFLSTSVARPAVSTTPAPTSAPIPLPVLHLATRSLP